VYHLSDSYEPIKIAIKKTRPTYCTKAAVERATNTNKKSKIGERKDGSAAVQNVD
jgi:hypothetical protein